MLLMMHFSPPSWLLCEGAEEGGLGLVAGEYSGFVLEAPVVSDALDDALLTAVLVTM